jgi:hypothetical protein
MEKKASFLFPDKEELQQYAEEIDGMKNKKIRIVLKIIGITGVRFGEAINGFFFRDADFNLFFQCISAKRGKLKMSKNGESVFLGKDILKNNLGFPIWKKIKCVNIFSLDIEELEELVSDEGEYIWIGEAIGLKSYFTAYKALKKNQNELKMKYKRNEDEELTSVFSRPAFHFFRKLFASEYYRKFGIASAVDKLKWKNINLFFQYVKEY